MNVLEVPLQQPNYQNSLNSGAPGGMGGMIYINN
jgi:hypothetical protein